MAWYKEWFGEEYLELYAHRDAGEAERQADFTERVLGSQGMPKAALDLACGAGRHTDALRRRGYRVLGVDLSLTLLAQRPDLPKVRADMGGLPFRAQTFDWVLNFFTSFGYFETESENFRVLEEVARVLTPGGLFLIDLMNKERAIDGLTERESGDLDGRTVEIRRWYDAASRRINKRIRLKEEGSPLRSFLESVRVYEFEEVESGLAKAGLTVSGRFGGFDGSPYQPKSERMILVAEKRA